MAFKLKRALIGRPLSNAAHQHQRLSNFHGLAVFASDALSSVAYATEEILLVLTLVTASNLSPILPISIAIVGLLLVVTFSYRETIHAYPEGGGAYIVSKDNLGTSAGLIAGASLLIDYVLTVSVSVAAGVAAIASAIPALLPYKVVVALVAILFITVVNLRGVKESSNYFTPPTYAFIILILLLVAKGFLSIFSGQSSLPYIPGEIQVSMEGFSWLIILRAFSSGCTALTGIEAVSNGVKAFQKPEHKNASTVLLRLGITLSLMFLGISFLSWHFHITPNPNETVLSQLARQMFGEGIMYVFIQTATCVILLLAANTAFNGFPALCSMIAKDRFLPRQLQHLGDRLVFSNAIVLLTFMSMLLIMLFHADTHSLIPLYAVGVFLSFTLSQFGMVVHQYKKRMKNWLAHLSVSLLGGITTMVVLFVILITKFTHGAWIICATIPVIVYWFRQIHAHYMSVQKDLQLTEKVQFKPIKNHVIIPISNIHKGVVEALIYAYTLSNDVQSVSIVHDAEQERMVREKWDSIVPGLPLVVIKNQFRSVVTPLLDFIKHEQRRNPDDIITIVIPSFIPVKWWHNLLHNQSSAVLQLALRNKKNVIVTHVHVHLNH
ncbi:MAG: APC family permease [Bdellovibrionota bacterium]